MEHIQHYINEVSSLKAHAEDISGLWNGEESGRGEERASVANEIVEKCNELKYLLEELKQLN